MTHTIKTGNLTLGEGRCKICAPMMGSTQETLLQELDAFRKVPFDLVEWRMDFFTGLTNPEQVQQTLQALRNELGEIPVICTLRTKEEGGNAELGTQGYVSIVEAVATSKLANFVDIELSSGHEAVEQLIQAAKSAGCYTILSHHNFFETYPCQDIESKFYEMMDYEADISKIALMPQSMLDVLTLLSASASVTLSHPERLKIAISMGSLGILSRLNAELTGSILTFGAASSASAPGQINTVDLLTALEIIHNTNSTVR